MRMLVTGGAGFIGSNFIRYWLGRHDDEIVNFDKLTYAGNLRSLDDVVEDKRYIFIQGDVSDQQAMHDAMQGVETVVHFAAESCVDRSLAEDAAKLFFQTNAIGTLCALRAAEKTGARFHYISTDEVFGHIELEEKRKFNEHTPRDPRNPYSISKAQGDYFVLAAMDRLPVTLSHCSNNYGPYQYPEKLIPVAITRILEGKKIPVYGEGRNVRDWLHVLDHCSAIEAILERGRPGESYCIGGQLDEEIPNIEVARRIASILGKDDGIEFVSDRPGHDLKYAIDSTKIRSELGWQPAHDFSTWLEKTVEWYVANEQWWRPLLQH
jgi:dTDP-glucose 4,6-dehydratase